MEIFSNIKHDNLKLILETALSNSSNKVHVEAIAKNENAENITIKQEFSDLKGNTEEEKLFNLYIQIKKLNLSEVRIIIRPENSKPKIFYI